MKKQCIYALLTAMILSSLAGCGSESGKNPESTTPKSTEKKEEQTTEPADPYASYSDDLPDDLDFDGRKFIFGTGETGFIKYDIGVSEPAGEIVLDAVYDRNLKVMERLNCEIVPENRNLKWGDYSNLVMETVLAGDYAWDVVDMACNGILQLGRSALFQNLAGLEYLDIDKEYWNRESIMELSIDGSSYQLLIGDGQLAAILDGGCVYFNKDLYRTVYEDPNELYVLANSGKWTLDVLMKCCEDIYRDVNNNAKKDGGDQMGLGIYYYWKEPNLLDYGCTYQRTLRDENGVPYVEFDLDKASYVYDKLYKLIHETDGIFLTDGYDEHQPFADSQFLSGNVLFNITELSYALGGARNMTDAWGILPMPKFDEEQKSYHNNTAGSFFAIPLTTPDTDGIGAVLEAMASEGHESVIEQFYSEALMSKYSPDEEASKAIKLITDSIGVDFARSYNTALGGYGQMVSLLAFNGQSFASGMQASPKAAATSLKKYIESLASILE